MSPMVYLAELRGHLQTLNGFSISQDVLKVIRNVLLPFCVYQLGLPNAWRSAALIVAYGLRK